MFSDNPFLFRVNNPRSRFCLLLEALSDATATGPRSNSNSRCPEGFPHGPPASAAVSVKLFTHVPPIILTLKSVHVGEESGL